MVKRLALSGLLTALLVALPAGASAAGCSLTATADPGHAVAIAGSGFAPGTAVTLDIARDGTRDGSQSLQADAAGSFTSSIDAGPGRGGDYTFSAASTACTATAEVVAVETAGAIGGTRPTPPPTDTLRTAGGPVPGNPLPLGLLLLTSAAAMLALATVVRRAARG